VKELQRAGIDMHTLSIVGKDTHTDEDVLGYYNTGDRVKYWGKIGAVLVASPLVGWMVGALEGAAVVGGLSAIAAARP
jgi:uncharacterized membrane protein